jgi:hypothetical protein
MIQENFDVFKEVGRIISDKCGLFSFHSKSLDPPPEEAEFCRMRCKLPKTAYKLFMLASITTERIFSDFNIIITIIIISNELTVFN